MRKKIYLAALIAAMTAVTGCGADASNGQSRETVQSEESGSTASAEIDVTDAVESKESVSVEFTEDSGEETHEDGTVLMSWSVQYPEVSIIDNKAAADKINACYSDGKTDFESEKEENLEIIREEYDYSKEEDFPFRMWSFLTQRSVQRKDNVCVSIRTVQSQDSGGAHPNSYETAENFATATGERLSLTDVVNDVEDAKLQVEEFIRTKINEEYKDYVLEDYEANIADILQEDVWVLDSSGFSVICNEYIIGPHALGIITFTIPYEECGFLKEEYKTFQ